MPPSPNHQILLGAHLFNSCNCFADHSPANAVSKAGRVSLHMFYLGDHCYLRACFALSFITAPHPPSHENEILPHLGDRDIKTEAKKFELPPVAKSKLDQLSLVWPSTSDIAPHMKVGQRQRHL